MAQNQEMEREEKESKLQWFLFIIVIPSLFAAALALVIMTIAGVNVLDTVKTFSKNIPIISQLVDVHKIQRKLETMIEKQNEVIEQQKKQINELENELSAKQQEVDRLKKEKEHLEEQLSLMEANKEELPEDKTATMNTTNNTTMEDIASMYETMSEKNAAMILTKMPESDVLTILSSLDSDKAAAILEKMPPDDAAKYTSMLAKRAEENPPVEEAAR
ncbi:magnesium transporter MgtE [Geobacillus sp. E263]|uniref:MotE family protein n=1 Tax=Geobacillus sp. E263 TaxID=391290 RepID=UPI001179AD22|nr:magnesium transporter MgtE [Geobacillus sp. E263]